MLHNVCKPPFPMLSLLWPCRKSVKKTCLGLKTTACRVACRAAPAAPCRRAMLASAPSSASSRCRPNVATNRAKLNPAADAGSISKSRCFPGGLYSVFAMLSAVHNQLATALLGSLRLCTWRQATAMPTARLWIQVTKIIAHWQHLDAGVEGVRRRHGASRDARSTSEV